MDLKEEEDFSSQNNSFDDNYNSHSNNDLFLFSKENMGVGMNSSISKQNLKKFLILKIVLAIF